MRAAGAVLGEGTGFVGRNWEEGTSQECKRVLNNMSVVQQMFMDKEILSPSVQTGSIIVVAIKGVLYIPGRNLAKFLASFVSTLYVLICKFTFRLPYKQN